MFDIICDLICNKGPLLAKHLWPNLWKGTTVKTSQNHFCIHTVAIYAELFIVTLSIQNCFWGILTMVPFHKSGHKCFNISGPLLQIRSHIQKIYYQLSMNQLRLNQQLNNKLFCPVCIIIIISLNKSWLNRYWLFERYSKLHSVLIANILMTSHL